MRRLSKGSSFCTDPGVGRHLDAYLERRLPNEEEQAFETHFFSCEACLEEIQFRQLLARGLGSLPDRSVPRGTQRRRFVPRESLGRGWLLAALCGAVVFGGLLIVTTWRGSHSPGRPGAVLSLDGVYRSGSAEEPQVEAGRAPLEISIFVPVLSRPGVAYDVSIVDSSGHTLYRDPATRPTGDSRVVVRVADGIDQPGTYRVRVTEKKYPGVEPLELEYEFFVLRRGDSK
jgi:putative zinc finger protein